jgi:multidrug efflux pump subunit AcrA (membrane-fusion protein)
VSMPAEYEAASDIPDKPPPPDEHGHAHKPHRPGHSPKYWFLFGIVVVVAALLVLFIGWLPRHKRTQEIDQQTKERIQALPRVDVMVVRVAPSTTELMVPGTTQAYTEAYIYARASGYVTRRFVDIGDRVHTGQLLATIDAPDLDKQVAQARSQLQQSESTLAQMQAQLHLAAVTWDRYKVLVAKGVFSRQDGDTQEANYRVAEANVRAAEQSIQGNRENLERLIVLQQYEQVRAPFNGVVTARNVDVGTLITAQGTGAPVTNTPASPGTSLAGAQANNEGSAGSVSASTTPPTGGSQGGEMFGIASIDRLRVLVSVPEAYSDIVHIGQRTQLFFQEMPNDKFEGNVTRTSSSIDENTRTLLVEVQSSNRNGQLLPGMYVVVNFINAKGQPPLLVPGAAIVVRNGKVGVYRIEDNYVHFAPIYIGRDYGDQTEVVGGLKAGEVIATTITDEVREGTKIDPQYPKKQGQPELGGQSDKSPGNSGQYGEQGLDNSAQKSSKSKSGGGRQQNAGSTSKQ